MKFWKADTPMKKKLAKKKPRSPGAEKFGNKLNTIFKKAQPKIHVLEKDIEKKIGDYAKFKKCLYMKFTSPAQRAVPDRMIITPQGVIGFLEAKRQGQVPTVLQARKMAELKQQGCHVTWCDNVNDGKIFIDMLIVAGSIKKLEDEPKKEDWDL